MPKVEQSHDPIKDHETDANSLKGTFVFVMLLGGFLIITWIGVWALYLVR